MSRAQLSWVRRLPNLIVMDLNKVETLFPAGLLGWSGHRTGGVRRLFYAASGRPTGVVVDTPLLMRLKKWAMALGQNNENTPRIVLLVGGPGNGKTEAVEFTIQQLDSAF